MIDNLNLKNKIKNNWYSIIITIALIITLLNYIELKSENNNLNKQSNNLKDNIENLEDEKGDVESENENLENENQELKENYDAE